MATTPPRIAITGRFRRGKDTLGDMLTREIPGSVERINFADALKAELAEMTVNYLQPPELMYKVMVEGVQANAIIPGGIELFELWMREHRDICGTGWQWWGQFRRQTCGEDYWINHPLFQQRYYDAAIKEHAVIITDMRHHNECEWATKNGFFTVRVNGPCRAEGEVRDRDHPSERFVDELNVRLEVTNRHTLDVLHIQALDILRRIEADS